MENKKQNTAAEESGNIFAVAEKQDEATANDGVFTLHHTRPLEHEGKSYSDPFRELTEPHRRELQMLGHTVIVANFDSEYLIRVCVKACTEPLGIDALGKLSIRDFNRLRNTVRGFLSRKE